MKLDLNENKTSNINKKGIFDTIGNILVCVFMMLIFCMLPLYFTDGYAVIAEDKYRFFMSVTRYSVPVLLFFIAVRVVTCGVDAEFLKRRKTAISLDICMLALFSANLVSFLASPYENITNKLFQNFTEDAKYGTYGWFMGFMSYLAFFLIYLLISRLFIYSDNVWHPVLLVAFLVSLWAILNRYGIYPVSMKFEDEQFLSSIGNENWLCGYESIIAPVGMGLYLLGEENKLLKKVLLLVFSGVSFVEILLNSSTSGEVALVCTFFVMLLISLYDNERMKRLSEEILLFSLSILTVKILNVIMKGRLNLPDDSTEFLLNPVIMVVCLILGFSFFIYVRIKKDVCPKNPKVTIWGLCILAGVFLVILVTVISINTKWPLPIIGDKEEFIFNDSWGSSRGITWSLGVENFKSLSVFRKLFGTGPDTFCFSLRDNERLIEWSNSYFGYTRLTNAHNEGITLLNNIGIMGTIAFFGCFVCTIMICIKKAKENPKGLIFVIALISYLSNNLFSFQHICNTPYVFILMAMAVSMLTKAPESVQFLEIIKAKKLEK